MTAQITRHAMLKKLYEAFNARDIDGALVGMTRDVDWPNGLEGGRVFGHDGVREYWTRQWQQVDSYVEAKVYASDEQGREVLTVHQVVKDKAGQVIVDATVKHAYTFNEEGRVSRMDILPA